MYSLNLTPIWNLEFERGSRWIIIDAPPLERDVFDMAYFNKGICCVLNLISDQGNGDLGKYPIQTGALAFFIDLVSVEYIIISQDSLMPGMDGICPGAYVSMTNINAL